MKKLIAIVILFLPMTALAQGQAPLPITLQPADIATLTDLLSRIPVRDANTVYNPIMQFLNAKEQEAQIAALKAKAEAEKPKPKPAAAKGGAKP